MFFDGAVRMSQRRKIIAGAGVEFISLESDVLPYAYSLIEPYSNNVAEYNALIIVLHISEEIGLKYLEAYGNSKLIVSQVKNKYEVRSEDLVSYYWASIVYGEIQGVLHRLHAIER